MLDIYICFEYNMNVMNIVRRIRLFYLLLALVSLVIGTVIYIFLRQGTYIHNALPEFVICKLIAIYSFIPKSPAIDCLRYYFVDFLWCFSLNFSLYAVLSFQSHIVSICISLLSAFLGFGFEMAQFFSLISGTYDFLDILMYIVASLCAVMINNKFIKRMG